MTQNIEQQFFENEQMNLKHISHLYSQKDRDCKHMIIFRYIFSNKMKLFSGSHVLKRTTMLFSY